MGVEPPFLYNPPTRSSFTGPTEKGFNPKAVSQASWSPRPARPKQEGPLINAKEFNKHPDSYLIVPYGNLDWKPMGPGTKYRVKYTRWLQLFLRICALLGAAGMLFCGISIKGTDSMLGWIIRLPPGIAMLHTIYAIYHLARSSKERTPSSSASYMLFAAIVDTGLIPFLVFTAMMARAQYTEPSDTQGRWQTLFGNDPATYKIIFSLFLFSVVNGSLHAISLLVSIYLAIIFRKISRLPPDMNPLEDNLTSRHKRNKSSLSSSTTPATSNRDSHLSDPLINPPRTVPFLHTRTESSTSLASPQRRHPNSNRASRTDLPSQIYQQPPSQRASRADLSHSPAFQPTINRSSMYADSRPQSARPPSIRPQSAHPSLLNDNWFTYPSTSRSPSPSTTNPEEYRHLRLTKNPTPTTYHPLPQNAPPHDSEPLLIPRPLEMHPPNAPTNASRTYHQIDHRALAPASGNRTILNNNDNHNHNNNNHDNYNYINSQNNSNSNNSNGHENTRPKSRPHSTHRFDSFGTAGGKGRFYGELIAGMGTGIGTGTGGREGRVVSSGTDIVVGVVERGQMQYGGGVRAREVSGKVIEEGRGMAF